MELFVLEPLKAVLALFSTLVLGPIMYGVIQLGKTLHRWHQIDKATDQLPGVPGKHWLWGTVWVDGLPVLCDITKRHNYKAAKEWVGPMPVVHVLHPELAKVFLATTYKNSLEGEATINKCLKSWLGSGLLLSEGDTWHRNRKLLTPAFHFKILQSYVKVYNAAIDVFIEKISQSIQSDESVEVCEPIHFMSLDIIMKCAFSFEDDVQSQGDNHPYIKAIQSLQEHIYSRIMTVYHHNDIIYKLTPTYRQFKLSADTAHRMADEIIRKRRLYLENDASSLDQRRLDFLDILLMAKDEDGQGMTDEEIRNEVDTFLFAGSETTATAMSWVLYLLAKHPDHQRRCQLEIDHIVVNRDVPTVRWEDLSQMPCLARCIKEAMRLYPPVPRVVRELREPLVFEELTVPAGTMVVCAMNVLHQNVNVWGEDCHEFNPDRFLPDNLVGMDSHAFLAFSAGPRNCIGQNFAMNEMKTVVSRILGRFWLEVDASHEVKPNPLLTLKAVNGIKLKFFPRNKGHA